MVCFGYENYYWLLYGFSAIAMRALNNLQAWFVVCLKAA
jgi:hypothetical protein